MLSLVLSEMYHGAESRGIITDQKVKMFYGDTGTRITQISYS